MGKMEVILRTERRRKWTGQDRQRILAECDEPGATIREVCERHQIAESLIYGWRAERRQKAMTVAEQSMNFIDCGMVPAENVFPNSIADALGEPLLAKPKRSAVMRPPIDHEMVPPRADDRAGLIEVLLPTGERLTVDSFVNEKALARVVRILRGTR